MDNINISTQEQFIEADIRAWLVLLAYVLILASGSFLFIDSLNALKPFLLGESKQVIMAKQNMHALFDYLIVFSLIHAMILSTLFIGIANRTGRAGQFPPDQTWVLVKTKIQFGINATRSQWYCYGCAVLVWFPLALPVYLKWLLDEVVRV